MRKLPVNHKVTRVPASYSSDWEGESLDARLENHFEVYCISCVKPQQFNVYCSPKLTKILPGANSSLLHIPGLHDRELGSITFSLDNLTHHNLPQLEIVQKHKIVGCRTVSCAFHRAL